MYQLKIKHLQQLQRKQLQLRLMTLMEKFLIQLLLSFNLNFI